jgi:hypothetical protein
MKLHAIYCLTLFTLLTPLLAISDKKPSFSSDPCDQSGKKGPTLPSCGCAPITEKELTIFLNFDASNDPRRICGVGVDGGSDPATQIGTTDPNNNSKYYCIVTITPNLPAVCLQGNYSTYKMVNPYGNGIRALKIRVPDGVVTTYKIDFYEKCNNCHDNKPGRPYYTFYGSYGNNDTFTYANLLYQYTNPC